MKRLLPLLLILSLAIFASAAPAQQSQFTNNSGFGMTNGQMGAPVIGPNGSAYIVTYTPAQNIMGTAPSSQSFRSTLIEITRTGQMHTVTLSGISSQPLIFNGVLLATASLADPTQFQVISNFGTSTTGQSMLYIVPIPIAENQAPLLAFAMDGAFASNPVVTNNQIYVVTSDFGNALMSDVNSFNSSFGTFDFTNSGQAKSWLYVINTNGTLAQKVELQ